MSASRSVHSPAALDLARQLVEKRLAYLSTFDGFVCDAFGPSDDESVGESLWGELLDALVGAAESLLDPEILRAFRDHVTKDPWSNVWLTLTAAHERAGFLVGLELGRRLGGAR